MTEFLFAADDTAAPRPVDAQCPRPDACSAPSPAGSTRPAGGRGGRQREAAAAEQPDCLRVDLYPPPNDDDDISTHGWPQDDDPEHWQIGVVDEDPDPVALAWAPSGEYPDDDEAESLDWLATMPAEVREDFLAGPYTGAGEAIPAGFTHRDPGGPSGVGFAAGGALDRLAPGPWLAQALADVTVAGHDDLGESELIGVLLGCQRQVAWSQARMAAAVSALAARRRAQAERPGWSEVGEHLVDELAVSLTMTGRSASRLLDVASGLRRLSDVANALEAGRIDWPKASLFVDELAVLSDEQAFAVASCLLDRAGEQTTAQLRAALARAVLAADPTAGERRRKVSRKDARVELWHEPSGNAALAGRELAPADVIAADAALTADAGWLRDNGAAGTLAELRAAAYIARLSGGDLADLLPLDEPADIGTNNLHGTGGPSDVGAASSAGSGSTASGQTRPRGSIHLTMPLAALAGLADAPGEVAGYGPADAPTCRDLVARLGATSRWCVTVTGPDGRAVGHACAGRRGPGAGQPLITWVAGLRDKLQLLESKTCRHTRQSPGYPWPTALRHLIEVRQRTCAAPGCRRPAVSCDIDHTIAFERGGPTCECNGSPLCRRHHRCKQAPGWRLVQDEPGIMTWRLPGGRSYTTTGCSYPI